ncbi:protein Wnt-11 isoform 2-T2 [Erethizon dorsatum]
MRFRLPPSATPSPGPAPLATCPAAPAALCQALRASLEVKCKCHGVSGSCSIRTCWKGLPELQDVAADLKTRYLSATKVVHRPMGTRKHLVPKDLDIRPVKDSELIYLQSSPDFCMKNEKVGSHGTQDRQCNKTSNGSDSCDLMCCGRGYNPYTDRVVERCHCKYHWCCYVTCRRCERTVERYVCK